MSVPDFIVSSKASGLFLSWVKNGIFATFVDADYKNENYVTYTSYTSYPFKDTLYPAWMDSYDFTEEFLSRLNLDFNKEIFVEGVPVLISNQKTYKNLHKGINQIISVHATLPHVERYLKESRLNSISLSKLNEVELIKNTSLLKLDENIIIVELDFFRIRVLEFTPVTLGGNVTWDYHISELRFKDVNEIIERALTGEVKRFLKDTSSAANFNDSFINALFYTPAKTSSLLMLDIFRAYYMDVLLGLNDIMKLSEKRSGFIFLTGEIPAYMDSHPDLLLLLIDSLNLKGLWGISLDTSASLLPMLSSDTKIMPIPSGVFLSEMYVVYVPEILEESEIVFLNDKKFLGASGDIFTFNKNDIKLNREPLEVVVPNKMYLSTPDNIDVLGLIMDLRERPIEYGPGPVENSSRIRAWLSRLQKVEDSRG